MLPPLLGFCLPSGDGIDWHPPLGPVSEGRTGSWSPTWLDGAAPEDSHPMSPSNAGFMGAGGGLWEARRAETNAALGTSGEKKPHDGGWE